MSVSVQCIDTCMQELLLYSIPDVKNTRTQAYALYLPMQTHMNNYNILTCIDTAALNTLTHTVSNHRHMLTQTGTCILIEFYI